MILRRLIHHLQHQHWTAVFLDFVIVVLGVFIGLQVQEWNTARTARAELNQQLIGLRLELEANLAHFTGYRAELVQQMEDVTALREAFKSEPPAISSNAFNAKFLNVQRIKVFAPDLTALNELAETGGLRRLKDSGLRNAIGDWRRELGNVNRNYADALRQRDGVMNPFILKNMSYGPLLEQSYIVGDGIGRSTFRNDVAALAKSREVDNQLAYRYGICGSTVYALDALVAETKRLVDRLASRERRQ